MLGVTIETIFITHTHNDHSPGVPAIKDELRAAGKRAVELGIFGAPSFTCADGELYWGNDRLDAALDRVAAGGG